MEQVEFIKQIEEKRKQIDDLKKDIKNLENEYGKINSKFKKDDIVTSHLFKNDNITIKCTGEYQYTYYDNSIVVVLLVIQSDNTKYPVGQNFAISEKYLTKSK